MNHWTQKYLTITYKDMNCSKFVEYVLKDHFGISMKFPQSEGSIFNQSKQIRDNVPLFCERTEDPEDGDMILMNGIRRMCHVGVFVSINRVRYVLHSESRMKGAALHRLSDLMNYGYSVEGFYKWQK